MKAREDWFEHLPNNRLIAEFSLWSANLANFESELKRIAGHADLLHIDVADGHFAPAFLFFPDLVAAIRKLTSIPIHIHLMVADNILLEQTCQFADAGADLISVHLENTTAIKPVFAELDNRGVRKGLVLKVDTPVAEVRSFVSELDFLTLLGTAIGVKGQGLNERATARLQEAKALIAAHGKGRTVLAADGGIRDNTVPMLRAAGAETVVLGSLAFGALDLGQRMAWLKGL